ncbi:replication/maintenance protein RepL [Campylobacter sp. faydin G-24]|uniref:Replication/maintenance protein RepL n=1 Tax=Campylobacter anatolicus TaxID=2829105 RepID=A0ABS5HJT1_9BACT|nr:replication/maintenance protein RepL [Campylobacter anatolicus]MBR8466259.1 replication/maintenance protein RepL [Campylobacter anatolicus]
MEHILNEQETAILGAILGEKKLDVITLLIKRANSDGFVNLSVCEICEILNVSKPTAISTIKLLKSAKAIKKIKNGVYKLNFKEKE